MLTVQGGVFYGWKKSAQAAQSGAPKNNGCCAAGCLWLRGGKLYAAVGGVCVFADAYGAAAGPRAADGLYGSCLQSGVESAAARGYVDTIINPEDTRKYVAAAFEMLYTKREDRPDKKHGTV